MKEIDCPFFMKPMGCVAKGLLNYLSPREKKAWLIPDRDEGPACLPQLNMPGQGGPISWRNAFGKGR